MIQLLFEKTKAVLFFLMLFNIGLNAQEIPVKLDGAVKAPVIFEFPDQHKSLLIFYTASSGELTISAVEVDESMKVLRSSPSDKYQSPKANDRFNLMGKFVPAGSNRAIVYFKAGKNHLLEASIDLNTLTIQIRKKLDLPSKSKLVGVVTANDKCYVIQCFRKKWTKGGKIVIRESADGQEFTAHTIAIDKSLAMFSKKYAPLVPVIQTETDPESASVTRDKIYTSNGKLYFITDLEAEDVGWQKGRTIWTVIDLKTFQPNYGYFGCFNNVGEDEMIASSAVLDEKLFQVCIKKDVIAINVVSLDGSKKVLFSSEIKDKDDIEQLLNTSMIVPAENIFRRDRSYDAVHKMSKRMLGLNPFLQVRKPDDRYIICVGGFSAVFVPLTNGAPNAPGQVGFPTTTSSGFTYDKTAFFYSAINAADFTHSDKMLEEPVQQQIIDIAKKNNGVFSQVKSEGTYWWNDQLWFGFYSAKEKAYIFKKLKDY